MIRLAGEDPDPPKTLPDDLVNYALEWRQLQLQQLAFTQQFQQPVLEQPGVPIPEIPPERKPRSFTLLRRLPERRDERLRERFFGVGAC